MELGRCRAVVLAPPQGSGRRWRLSPPRANPEAEAQQPFPDELPPVFSRMGRRRWTDFYPKRPKYSAGRSFTQEPDAERGKLSRNIARSFLHDSRTRPTRPFSSPSSILCGPSLAGYYVFSTRVVDRESHYEEEERVRRATQCGNKRSENRRKFVRSRRHLMVRSNRFVSSGSIPKNSHDGRMWRL